MCGYSCSAEVGSCVCPCSDRGEVDNPNGPWNGQWPVARCCCATINVGDRCVADSVHATRVRNAATERDDRRTPAPTAAYPRIMQHAAAPATRLFGEVCEHFSECHSGICAEGCDCDNARLLVPQSCSCNCPTPLSPSVQKVLTCGSFLVGADPCLQHCPPCDAAVCADLSRYTCRYLCVAGSMAGACSDYPAYFLNAAPLCVACCNLDMCPVSLAEATLRAVWSMRDSSAADAAALLSGAAADSIPDDYAAFAAMCAKVFPQRRGGAVRGVARSQTGIDAKREDFWTHDKDE